LQSYQYETYHTLFHWPPVTRYRINIKSMQFSVGKITNKSLVLVSISWQTIVDK